MLHTHTGTHDEVLKKVLYSTHKNDLKPGNVHTVPHIHRFLQHISHLISQIPLILPDKKIDVLLATILGDI